MEILQVSAYCGPEGGNYIASMLSLAEKMRRRGYKTVYAICETMKTTSWCCELQKQSKVYFLPVHHARAKIQTYKILRSIYKQHDIRVVHTHFELYDIPVIATAPKSVRVIWHLHDPIADGFGNQPLSRRILTWLQYSHCGKRAKLITCSEKHGDFALKLGFPPQSMFYIPNGLDLSRIKNTCSYHKKPEFLMFCWDFYRKGGDLALQAADKLYAERRWEFRCRFVPGIPLETRDYVISQKPVKDVNELFRSCGAFLHLSRSEGLSYALLEAIYAGLPVICTNIPENMPVSNCPIVHYVDAGNSDQIYIEMKNLLEQGFMVDERKVMVSRNEIEKKFSISSWCDKIIKVYLE